MKKQRQKKITSPLTTRKKSTSKKSETKPDKPALAKIRPKASVDLEDLKAENLRLYQLLELKTRELEIEAALERMRASAMAMHSSEGLYNTAEILYQELSQLGIENSSSGFGLVDERQTGFLFMV